MSWLFFALISYLIAAAVAVLDKVILSKQIIPRPAVYAAYVGLSGIYAAILIPFGFDFKAAVSNPAFVFLAVLSGFIWLFFLIPMYASLKEGEVSRAAAIIGAFTALFTFVLSFFFLGERLNAFQIAAFFILVLGAFLISSKNSNLREYSFKMAALAVLSAFILSVSFVLIKFVYSRTNFWNAYIAARFGELAGGLFLLALPAVRGAVAEHFKTVQKRTVGYFAAAKTLGAIFFILQNYAIFLGSVSLVQALVGLQYVFLLFLAALLSVKFPAFLKEELSKKIIGRKIIAVFLIALGLSLLALSRRPENLAPGVKIWGATFSKPFAEQLGLDWKKVYLAGLDDLNLKAVRLSAYWNEVEPAENEFDFSDLDWQVEEAAKRGVKIILAAGLKLPRWPECHAPRWLREFLISNSKFLNKKEFEEEKLLQYIEAAINRYKNNPAVWAWQIENEPFLAFGECPTIPAETLDKEIALVKSLDGRPLIVSDSGELSFWVKAAKRADIFGTTMYRVVWSEKVPFGGYLKYPLPPEFFWLKTNIASYFAGIKKIIVVELQGEPWGPKLLSDTSYEEQMKSMDFGQFLENIDYAKKAGFEEVYWFGWEWWYKMKETGHPEYWEEVKKLVSSL